MGWATVVTLLFLVASRGCRGARNLAAVAKRQKNVASGTLSPEAYWQKTVPNVPIPASLLPLFSPLTSSGAAHFKRSIRKGKLMSNQRLSFAFCDAAGLFCNPDIPDPLFLHRGEVEPLAEGWRQEMREEPGPWGLLRIEEERMESEMGLQFVTDIFNDDEPLIPPGDYDDFYDLEIKPDDSPPEPESSRSGSGPLVANWPRTWMKRFFTLSDLETGDLDFHAAHLLEAPITRKLLTPDMAGLLPIYDTQGLLRQLHIPSSSQMGRSMVETASRCCDLVRAPGETMACVSSLEALADFLASQSLEGSVEVITVPTPTDEFLSELSMGPLEIVATEVKGDAENWQYIACRNRMFPFQVFECSSLTNTQVMVVYLDSSSQSDVDATALAICHMNTAEWSPDHEAFLHLGRLPGETEICQFLPQHAFVFLWPKIQSSRPRFGSTDGNLNSWPDST